jgi:hypothetical protein
MSEMIELVAKRIAWHHHDRKQWTYNGVCTKKARNDYYAEHEWKTFVPAAQAVIEALREAGRFKPLTYDEAWDVALADAFKGAGQ